MEQPNNPTEAIQSVVDQIRAELPSLLTLYQFFQDTYPPDKTELAVLNAVTVQLPYHQFLLLVSGATILNRTAVVNISAPPKEETNDQ